MNQKELNYIRKELTRQLEDLLGDGDCNLQGLEKTESPLPDKPPHNDHTQYKGHSQIP